MLCFHGRTRFLKKTWKRWWFLSNWLQNSLWFRDVRRGSIPALLSTRPLERHDFGVLKVSLSFRSRGTLLPVNYLDLLSQGVRRYKDKTWKYSQSTPRKTGSLKCQNMLGGDSFAPLIFLWCSWNFCIFRLKRRKPGIQCWGFWSIRENFGFSRLQMITYLQGTSQGRWPCMAPPGTWAHCRWCLEPWLQTLTQALRACWFGCQQLVRVGCSKASPPCQGSLRHGCPLLFGQLWKWSLPRLQRGCTSPHCPPYRGRCAAKRQKRGKKTSWLQTLAQIMIHGERWGSAVNEHHITKIVKETDCIKEQIHVHEKICRSLKSREK